MVGGLTVFGNRAHMLAVWKKTPSTHTFSKSLIVTEYKSYLWKFLKRYCRSDFRRNTQKHGFALTGSLPRVNYQSAVIYIENVFPHITLKKVVRDFQIWFFLFEMDAKLNNARHSFLKEVSWNIPVDFQPIPSEDVRKRRKLFTFIHSYILSRKDEKSFVRFQSLGVKNPLRTDRCGMGKFTTTMALSCISCPVSWGYWLQLYCVISLDCVLKYNPNFNWDF